MYIFLDFSIFVKEGTLLHLLLTLFLPIFIICPKRNIFTETSDRSKFIVRPGEGLLFPLAFINSHYQVNSQEIKGPFLGFLAKP